MTINLVDVRNAERSRDKLIVANSIGKNIDGTYSGEQSFSQIISEKQLNLIFYFASWCTYCRQEVEDLKNIQNEYPTKLGIIGISGDALEVEVKNISHVWGISWPLFWDSTHQFKKKQDIKKIPYLILVNSKRQILATHVSISHLKDFFQEVRQRLSDEVFKQLN